MTRSFRARLGGSLVVNVAGAAAVFVSQFFVAHFAGVEAYGIFAFVFALAQILVVLSKLGYDSAVQKLIPQYVTGGEYQLAAGLVCGALGVPLIVGLACTAALAALAAALVEVETLRHSMYVAALLVPVIGVLKILRGVLLGFQQTVRAQVFDPLVIYTLWMVIVGVDAIRGIELTSLRITTELLLVTTAAAFCHLAVAKRSLPREVAAAKPVFNHRVWVKIALPMMLAYGLVVLMTYTDSILIGILIGTDEAGVYMVSARLASAVSMPIAFLGAALAATVAELSTKKDYGLLQQRITATARFGFLLALPIAAAIGLGGEFMLGLIGDSFVAGGMTTRILILAQLVNVVAGPVGLVLMMSGSHIQVGRTLAAMTVVNIILNLLLIPVLGIAGAAIATGCAIIFRNYTLRRRLRENHNLDASAFPRP